MAEEHDTSRHVAPERDTSRYTDTVDEVLITFANEGLDVSKRTIQRYCKLKKLDCIPIDPDTRQPTDRNSYTYLIDPTSVPPRMRQVRERNEFDVEKSTPPSRATSRLGAPERDTSRHDAPPKTEDETVFQETISQLEEDNRILKNEAELEKKLRQQLQLQRDNDRTFYTDHLDKYIDQLTAAKLLEGNLKAQLSLSVPKENNSVDGEGDSTTTETS